MLVLEHRMREPPHLVHRVHDALPHAPELDRCHVDDAVHEAIIHETVVTVMHTPESTLHGQEIRVEGVHDMAELLEQVYPEGCPVPACLLVCLDAKSHRLGQVCRDAARCGHHWLHRSVHEKAPEGVDHAIHRTEEGLPGHDGCHLPLEQHVHCRHNPQGHSYGLEAVEREVHSGCPVDCLLAWLCKSLATEDSQEEPYEAELRGVVVDELHADLEGELRHYPQAHKDSLA
mmetsp:Transcript_9638/g.20458  ORF Transcript_9638/g.20458 Transcript_9638/m.20458 type:complete len:231 (+) Transcript_9638:296-988(+)